MKKFAKWHNLCKNGQNFSQMTKKNVVRLKGKLDEYKNEEDNQILINDEKIYTIFKWHFQFFHFQIKNFLNLIKTAL